MITFSIHNALGKLRSLVCAVPLAALLGACGLGFPTGLVQTDTVFPLHIGDGYPWRKSETCARTRLGLVVEGDASVRTAMQNAQLGRVALVERRVTGSWGNYKICTVVYGPWGDFGPPPEGPERG